MKSNSRIAWSLIAAFGILAAVAYYLWADIRNPAAPTERITVAVVDFAGDAPTIIASMQGYFREEGLDVTLKRKSAGVLALRDLMEHKVEIATASEYAVVRMALDKNWPTPSRGSFLIVGDIVYSYRSQQVIARSDRKIHTAADLKGRRVGIPAGNTSIDFHLGNLLRQNGIADADVKTVQLDGGSLVAALEKGDIDAFICWEPFISEAKTKLGEGAFVFPGNPLYSTSWLVVVRDELAKRAPELVPKFLRAIKRAEGFIHARPEEAVTMVARHTGIDRQIVARTWTKLDFRLSLSQALVATMEEEARWLIGTRRIGAAEVPDFLDYIHTAPLRSISPAAVTVIK